MRRASLHVVVHQGAATTDDLADHKPGVDLASKECQHTNLCKAMNGRQLAAAEGLLHAHDETLIANRTCQFSKKAPHSQPAAQRI
jgi:hypothetical protein